jgi:hypothetical protein
MSGTPCADIPGWPWIAITHIAGYVVMRVYWPWHPFALVGIFHDEPVLKSAAQNIYSCSGSYQTCILCNRVLLQYKEAVLTPVRTAECNAVHVHMHGLFPQKIRV